MRRSTKSRMTMEHVTLIQAIGITSATSFAVSLCVVYFARKYFGSYLTEKAKNLASKEDIADITKLSLIHI